ncbi:xenotropic and polytropic retrovirus receptor 1 [Nematocida minor]|uniref:xenotropic and polytropic retrovirus receptor 1 n=1 Tax=Nematocida minor TaxID=1912983 RepID=UPI00222113D0|nr:xenotropic and polytropic retrovirus receptor 1 [Nematocida minor]KAI5189874.1 xenotropic and polytropic retrovirus receptor 1 [Nematocida minor]
MKFSKTLKEKQVQEWRTKYLNYETLKDRIREPQETFLSDLNREVEKVELFYKVLERGILRGLADLLELFPEDEFPYAYEIVYDNWRLAMVKSVSERNKRSRHERHKKKVTRKIRENKVLEFYVAINKVLQYKKMNITGFRKILKKYDKLNGTSIQETKMADIQNRSIFVRETIEEIMQFNQYIHKEITPDRKKDKAKRLVVDLTQEDAEGDGKSFSAGSMVTAGIFLMVLSLYSDFSLYYSFLYTFDILLIIFGVLFYVCRKNLVNYSLILELNLKPKLKISRYFLMTTIMLLVHSVSGYLSIHWGVAYAITFAIWIMPFNYFFKEIRFYFIQTVSEMFACTVLGKVRFKHFFIADHLLSVRPALILAMSAAFKSSPDPIALIIVNLTPVVIRIFQCLRRHFEKKNRQPFPHLYNTLKYLISFFSDTLLILSDNINVWVCVAAVALSNVFGLGWDVYVDWMLWNRPKVYSKKMYLIACAFNVAVRSASVGSLVMLCLLQESVAFKTKLSIKFSLCCLEILRRLIWGVIRIEVEHLNNCNQLKAISGPLSDLFYLEDDGQLE